MLPGGIAEIFTARPGAHVVVFRKGLCRLALQERVDLIPVYVFGANDNFSNLATGNGWFAQRCRKFRLGVTFFWGYLGLPLPYVTDMTMVVGNAIRMDEVAPPSSAAQPPHSFTEEHVDRLHGLAAGRAIDGI